MKEFLKYCAWAALGIPLYYVVAFIIGHTGAL